MTPITWQAAVDDEEQRPLLQDILEAAVDDRRQVLERCCAFELRYHLSYRINLVKLSNDTEFRAFSQQ